MSKNIFDMLAQGVLVTPAPPILLRRRTPFWIGC